MIRKTLCLSISLFITFFTIAQTPKKIVIAVNGDGIYSILRKNGLDPTKYFDQFIKLNKKSLTKNNGLFIGKKYVLPAIKTDKSIAIKSSVLKDSISSKAIKNNKITEATVEQIYDPIFGKNHNPIVIKNKKLKGAIYYLISGHGGPDPGAMTTYNSKSISEDEYAYDVSLRLARLLISNGAKVYLIIQDKNDGIRDDKILEVDYDEYCYPDNTIPLSQNLRLRQRTKAVNKLFLKHKGAYQRLIVTHVDSRNKGKNIDVFFYHDNKSKSGKRLAENIYNSFKEKYNEHQPNRKYLGSVSPRGLYVIKSTLPAMVYIEIGNIKNKKDQKRILNYQNREALAQWIHNGLLVDFEEN
ncbi:N-acetylmuramoyl-L-alanine amidase [Aureibaculum marinum]|uniref:N-acetylmuramoyl-L-alanine amidase n=1 Tax=Aureibaculum marinum TaxID=2487930 RepID=A0A3N4P483_9FLAO|nr:N-acetylmuramoyl-L-alanine amidase [Aureibaculum marinum]RPD98539.1 N-acetylmuramoyl-L-alanine amidase [Aureibaculum marinum]